MAHVFKNHISNFANFDHAVEVGIKTLNELFGRNEPLEEFDSSLHDDGTVYVFGYMAGEDKPDPQKPGEQLSDQARAHQSQLVQDETKLDQLAGSTKQPLEFKLAQSNVVVSINEMVRGAFYKSDLTLEDWNKLSNTDREQRIADFVSEFDVLTPDTTPAPAPLPPDNDPDGVSLATEYNVDLKQVTGTGDKHQVTRADVVAYLQAKNIVIPGEDEPTDPAITTQPRTGNTNPNAADVEGEANADKEADDLADKQLANADSQDDIDPLDTGDGTVKTQTGLGEGQQPYEQGSVGGAPVPSLVTTDPATAVPNAAPAVTDANAAPTTTTTTTTAPAQENANDQNGNVGTDNT